MRNRVVHRMAKALRRTGAAVLRFNFRGVNLSEGAYDRGVGEVEDARAALAWLRARYPELPYTLAGFSFGARVVLRLGCSLTDPKRIIAAGLPTSWREPDSLEGCQAPKVFIQSTSDAHGPRHEMEAYFVRLTPPKTLVWIEAHDHFFTGALDEFEETLYKLAGREE